MMNQLLLFHNIDVILSNLSFRQTHRKLTGMHFSGFVGSSPSIHQIMQHADDISKLLGCNAVTLFALL